MSEGVEERGPILSPRYGRRVRWARRVTAGLLSLVFVLACAGSIYQWIASKRDRRLNPPPGLLVDVGGYKMHLCCIGEGSPTVVLDSGVGDTWLAWYKVQPQIAQFTRVCSYDRAGMGWSDPSPKPRTSSVVAQELHTLLRNAGIMPPFVLVGHSFGGLNIRMYAGLYPPEVVGMVLVDATPDHFDRFPPELQNFNDTFLRKETWKQNTMPLGIPRLMGWCGKGPPEIRSMLRTIDCRLGPWREHLDEYHAGEESRAEVRAVGLLGNIPLVVLSHDPDHPNDDFAKAMQKAWDETQAELTHLSTNSAQVIAKASTHSIQLDRPDVVIAAIHKVVDQCRAFSAAATGAGL
jgi:pimeloyl-ACP methyl ester carboxylesterase